MAPIRFLLCFMALLLGPALASEGEAPAPVVVESESMEPGQPSYQAAYLKIEDAVEPQLLRYYKRALADAREADVPLVVTHITSPGGLLSVAQEMLAITLDQATDGPRMVAYIDQSAFSAAAMLAYGHDEIWMAPGSIIGDIGVVYRNQDGELTFASEKVETAVRAMLRTAAEVRGWDGALLGKMTAHGQHLYQARFADGRRVHVLEEDRGLFLADHPEIDAEDPTQWVLVRGTDQLLTYVTDEAIAWNMATGKVNDLEALYAQLDIDSSQVLDLSPTPTERTSRWLTSIAPILLSLAVLCLLFEMQSPSFGLWAGLAALFGVGFLTMQYSYDLLSHIELVLLVLGFVLIIVEVFTAVGGGLIGLSGGALLLGGAMLSFLPNGIEWNFDNESFVAAFSHAAGSTLIALALVGIGLGLFIVFGPRLPFLQRVSANGVITATSVGTVEALAESGASGSRRGRVLAECRPAGTVELDSGEIVSARAEHGGFLESGTAVEVVEARFGEMVVRAVEEARAESESDAS
jgi:membrane-bound serine protease (ClpP class)